MLLGLQDAVIGYDRALQLEFLELLIEMHVAGFVFSAAAAPARVISLYFVLSQMNHSVMFLSMYDIFESLFSRLTYRIPFSGDCVYLQLPIMLWYDHALI
jgi:hypothetical protein